MWLHVVCVCVYSILHNGFVVMWGNEKDAKEVEITRPLMHSSPLFLSTSAMTLARITDLLSFFTAFAFPYLNDRLRQIDFYFFAIQQFFISRFRPKISDNTIPQQKLLTAHILWTSSIFPFVISIEKFKNHCYRDLWWKSNYFINRMFIFLGSYENWS